MSSVKIIPAEEQHIPAACDIAIRAWTPIRDVFRKELGDELYKAHFKNWQQSKQDGVARQLRSGRGYVAVIDEKVVGFVSYSVNETLRSGEICGNAVDPDCRGMGIGPKMYDFVLNKMREEGMEFATVVTGLDDGHGPARRAYEKAGFQKNLPSVKYFRKL